MSEGLAVAMQQRAVAVERGLELLNDPGLTAVREREVIDALRQVGAMRGESVCGECRYGNCVHCSNVFGPGCDHYCLTPEILRVNA